MKRINSSFSTQQEQRKEEENSCEYSNGIMKTLLEKYKPSGEIKVLNISRERKEEQRAA